MFRSFLIPVDICKYVVKHNLYRSFQFYLLLKSQCDGQLRITNDDYETYATTLGMKHGKSLKITMQKLLKLNWVGYNTETEFYYIRGIKKVQSLVGGRSRCAAYFEMDRLHDLKAFVAAQIMGYLARCQRAKELATGLVKRSPNHIAGNLRLLRFYQMANKAVAAMLGIAQSTVFELKKLAEKANFIIVKKNFQFLGMPKQQLSILNRMCIPNANRIRIVNGQCVLQTSDTIHCNLSFNKRKKLEH